MIKICDFEILNKIINAFIFVVAQQDNNKKSSLLLIFMGNVIEKDRFLPDEEESEETISVYDVWSNFTSDKCSSFRNKPKVFIFQVIAT